MGDNGPPITHITVDEAIGEKCTMLVCQARKENALVHDTMIILFDL